MEPLNQVFQSGPSVTPAATDTTYASKLRSNPLPQVLADRASKKAFSQVDSNVIGTAAVINGRKTIFLSKEEDEFMAAPFQYALVGKFSHGYPTMTRLRAKFAALGLNQSFKIGVLDQKHVWIRLFDPNDYARIWLKQTWYFDGFPMRVLKWSPEFDPKEESPIMPIWIKIFGLKPHWFHRQFLYHVASLLGKPLKLDEATTDIDNPVVARICVEVNVLEKLHSDIPVQYEGIPEYCRICRHRGHTLAACYTRKELEQEKNLQSNTEDVRIEEDLRARLNKKRGKKQMEDNGEGSAPTSIGNMEIPNYILMRNNEVVPLIQPRQHKTKDLGWGNLADTNLNKNGEKMDEEGNVTKSKKQQTNDKVGSKEETLNQISNEEGKNENKKDDKEENSEEYQERMMHDQEDGDGEKGIIVLANQEENEGNLPSLSAPEVEVPCNITDDIDVDSSEMENNELGWEEVSSRKHRRGSSLDGKNKNNPELAFTRMRTRKAKATKPRLVK